MNTTEEKALEYWTALLGVSNLLDYLRDTVNIFNCEKMSWDDCAQYHAIQEQVSKILWGEAGHRGEDFKCR